MRILFLTRLYWPHVGGVERHTASLSSSLSKRGHKVKILTTRYAKGLKAKENKDSIEVIRFGQPKIKLLGLIYTWFWLVRNINLIKKSDIVHVHDVFVWYLPFRFIFPKKPVYTTFHGWEGKYPIPSINILQKKIASKLSSKTISVGKYINKYYGISSDYVTYGGVGKYESKFKKKENKIIYVGRLDEDTGIPILLKLFERYNDIYHWYKVDFLGDGELRKECEKFGKVKGFVDPTQSYEKASICFASGYLTILEAMANKCMVICAYDNPLKKDYYRLTPFKKWIITSDSPVEIAKVLRNYSKNKNKYKNMIEEGYNWVITQTWERLTNSYIKLWEIE